MATSYTPVSMHHARAALARAGRYKHSAAEVQTHRADLTVANLVRAVDHAVEAGAVLDADRVEYLVDYLTRRLSLQAEVSQ